MKVISKRVVEAENPDGTKTNILDLIYTHKSKKEQRILVKDYDDSTYDYVLKQLKKHVSDFYNLNKIKGVQ